MLTSPRRCRMRPWSGRDTMHRYRCRRSRPGRTREAHRAERKGGSRVSRVHEVPMCRQRIDPGEWKAHGGAALGDRAYGTVDIPSAIAQAASDARMSYQIAYDPPMEKWDGKYHKIPVTDRKSVV